MLFYCVVTYKENVKNRELTYRILGTLLKGFPNGRSLIEPGSQPTFYL